jgi:hypothetical protein
LHDFTIKEAENKQLIIEKRIQTSKQTANTLNNNNSMNFDEAFLKGSQQTTLDEKAISNNENKETSNQSISYSNSIMCNTTNMQNNTLLVKLSTQLNDLPRFSKHSIIVPQSSLSIESKPDANKIVEPVSSVTTETTESESKLINKDESAMQSGIKITLIEKNQQNQPTLNQLTSSCSLGLDTCRAADKYKEESDFSFSTQKSDKVNGSHPLNKFSLSYSPIKEHEQESSKNESSAEASNINNKSLIDKSKAQQPAIASSIIDETTSQSEFPKGRVDSHLVGENKNHVESKLDSECKNQQHQEEKLINENECDTERSNDQADKPKVVLFEEPAEQKSFMAQADAIIESSKRE